MLEKETLSRLLSLHYMLWKKEIFISFGILCASFAAATGSAYAMRAIDGASVPSPTAVEEPAIPESDRHIQMPILVYHSVRPAYEEETYMQQLFNVYPVIFKQQMAYLRDHQYSLIPLSRLESFLTSGTPLPHCPVVITFDDGWENQFIYAFPILKEFNVPATIYIIADAIDDPAYLTWTQVQTMAAEGMTIGSHTRTHPNLADVYDESDLENEVVRSKAVIEKHLGTTVNEFAYPYGSYNQHTIDLVKQAGYTSGRSFTPGKEHSLVDLYTLKGIRVPNDMEEFIELLPVCSEQ